MKKLIYLVLLLFFLVLVLTINLKNPQSVQLEYYFGIQWDGPLVWLLTITFCLGLLIGGLLMSVSVFKNKRVAGKTRKELAKVEREVENLRTMPIKDQV